MGNRCKTRAAGVRLFDVDLGARIDELLIELRQARAQLDRAEKLLADGRAGITARDARLGGAHELAARASPRAGSPPPDRGGERRPRGRKGRAVRSAPRQLTPLSTRRAILIAMALATVVRVATDVQVRDGSFPWLHAWAQSDMAFNHEWARDIAGGNVLGVPAPRPYHRWHGEVALEAHRRLGAREPFDERWGRAIWNRWLGDRSFYQDPLFAYTLARRVRGGRGTARGLDPAGGARRGRGRARRVHGERAVGRGRRAARRVDGRALCAAAFLRRHARAVDAPGAHPRGLAGGGGVRAAGRAPRAVVDAVRRVRGARRARPRDQRALRPGPGPVAWRHAATRSPPPGRPRVWRRHPARAFSAGRAQPGRRPSAAGDVVRACGERHHRPGRRCASRARASTSARTRRGSWPRRTGASCPPSGRPSPRIPAPAAFSARRGRSSWPSGKGGR